MKRILYIDTPFAHQSGGDKNRSRFLWQQLSSRYEADLLLLNNQPNQVQAHTAYRELHQLSYQMGRGLQPEAIYSFNKQVLQTFSALLIRRKYDAVVLRFAAPAALAEICRQILPEAEILVDIDMVFSRLSELAWKRAPGLRNRYHWIQGQKLKAFERRLFAEDYTFLFSNPQERDAVLAAYEPKQAGRFQTLPNVMPKQVIKVKEASVGENVLFFGTLDSAANTDAFKFLRDQIYPLLEPELIRLGIRLRVVGQRPTALYQNLPQLEIVGACADMATEIASARCVLLPLRVASGTRTRILEAAACARAVVTTPLGAEGLELESLALAETARELANQVLKFLAEPEQASALGMKLQSEALARYAPETVAQSLFAAIEQPLPTKRRRIALVSNRFFPEIGGAEINIYHQARALAQQHEVTVFCPRRIDKPSFEYRDGFSTWRLKDSLAQGLPNIKARTFCPDMFWKILRSNHEIVQLFPALNPNNFLALAAARLSGKKTILCSFDYLDYAALIPTGQLEPEILSRHRPGLKERVAMRMMHAIFAISDRELAFFRRYNSQVAYSPVPVLPEEFTTLMPDPRKKYDIASEEFVFLCLGRVSAIKGQDLALKAFIEADLPNSRLVLVGRSDYEPEYLQQMQSLIKEHGLEKRVIFTGMVARDEALGWLQHAQIHVIPVRFMNSGAVVVESWMGGIPVIQSDAVDPNLVIEGENGYLFPSQNVAVLVRKMAQAYSERPKLSAMARSGQRLVRQNYTYDALIRIYERCYDRLLPQQSVPLASAQVLSVDSK
jgi:glycosyltransferase involved in cell wall biosynthesis